jgi:hypothetical protein
VSALQEGGEGVFVLKPGATWLLMPVRIGTGRGQMEPLAPPAPKKKRKGKKAEEAGEEDRGEWEEVTLQSLTGCPWKGELRLAAVYSPTGRKGADIARTLIAMITFSWKDEFSVTRG